MANDCNKTSAKKLELPQVLKWSQEQFKELGEQRRAFEQHMWQFPVATLGVVALLLNATKAFSVSTSSNPRLVVAILLLSFGMCIYGIFFLCRLRARRKVREERIKSIEDRIFKLSPLLGDRTSVVTSGCEVTEQSRNSKRLEDRCFGQIGTTRLGVFALGIAAVVLAFAILCLSWGSEHNAKGVTEERQLSHSATTP